MAVVPPETDRLLRDLTLTENISLMILSGRSVADLKTRIGLDCILAGNHGLEICGGGIGFVHERATELRHAVQCVSTDLEAALAGVLGVLVEDKGLTSTVHYRMALEELRGWIEATVHMIVRPYTRWLGLHPARKAWEIRPRVEWNKGSALDLVVRSMADVDPLVVCAGDDVTDEDMYRALPESISIQVGGRRPTTARYHVEGPKELAAFLGNLVPAVAQASGPRMGGPEARPTSGLPY
jgi:trehalose-phosphatase